MVGSTAQEEFGTGRYPVRFPPRADCCFSAKAEGKLSLGGHVGIGLGWLWGRFGIILGAISGLFGNNLLIILGVFWDRFVIRMGSIWNNFEIHFGHCVFRRGVNPPARLLSPQSVPYIPALWYPPAPHFCRQMLGLRRAGPDILHNVVKGPALAQRHYGPGGSVWDGVGVGLESF